MTTRLANCDVLKAFGKAKLVKITIEEKRKKKGVQATVDASAKAIVVELNTDITFPRSAQE